MRAVQQIDFIDQGFFVVDENLNVFITQQVQIHFVIIVADGSNKRSVLIKHHDLLIN